jgi:hypothetical protein
MSFYNYYLLNYAHKKLNFLLKIEQICMLKKCLNKRRYKYFTCFKKKKTQSEDDSLFDLLTLLVI